MEEGMGSAATAEARQKSNRMRIVLERRERRESLNRKVVVKKGVE